MVLVRNDISPIFPLERVGVRLYSFFKNSFVTLNDPSARRFQKSKYCEASVSLSGMSLMIRKEMNGT